MSRVGKKPITIPKGVEVRVDGAAVQVKGPKGSIAAPILAGAVIVAAGIGTGSGDIIVGFIAAALAASVFAAVHHAEVVAHRVGEPFGGPGHRPCAGSIMPRRVARSQGAEGAVLLVYKNVTP